MVPPLVSMPPKLSTVPLFRFSVPPARLVALPLTVKLPLGEVLFELRMPLLVSVPMVNGALDVTLPILLRDPIESVVPMLRLAPASTVTARVLAKVPLPEVAKVPAATVRPPVNVLAAVRFKVPLPLLTSAPAPMKEPASVLVPLWLMTRVLATLPLSPPSCTRLPAPPTKAAVLMVRVAAVSVLPESVPTTVRSPVLVTLPTADRLPPSWNRPAFETMPLENTSAVVATRPPTRVEPLSTAVLVRLAAVSWLLMFNVPELVMLPVFCVPDATVKVPPTFTCEVKLAPMMPAPLIVTPPAFTVSEVGDKLFAAPSRVRVAVLLPAMTMLPVPVMEPS